MRAGGLALALLFLSLAPFAAANAQSQPLNYGFCYGLSGNPRVNNFTPVFPVGSSKETSLAQSDFLRHMHERYGGYTTPELLCQFYATEAEARGQRRQLMDEGRKYPQWPVTEIDWTPRNPDAAAGEAPAPAPAAAKPKAPAPAAAPPPAPVAAAPAPAPAKPPVAAAKPGVYVICRSEWNTGLRRFYNPPVEVGGGGYPEWQASYRQFLASRYKFQATNVSCGKYPARDAAQADFESWVVQARQQPTINGQNSPITITNWKY
jgi:hypothetical protein